jgi:hypothetical protein
VAQPPLQKRLLADLRETVSATTGSERYDSLFKTVTGRKASALVADNALWEAIRVLFHFRNVIAHARAVNYTLRFPAGVGGYWEEEFSGGYKKLEDYLRARNMIDSRHIEEADDFFYFRDEIADLFWGKALAFVNTLAARI